MCVLGQSGGLRSKEILSICPCPGLDVGQIPCSMTDRM